MMMIGEPLGWDEKVYRDNIELQDDFLEELNITTYNGFKDYLFYDVIQALTKVYIVQEDVQQHCIENSLYLTDNDDFYRTENTEEEAKGEDKTYEKVLSIDHELKLELRLELEFEHIDDER
jgi:hypothetical protein